LASDLQIVAGRVVHAQADLVTIEFPPGELPAAGTALSNPAGTFEVLATLNPSEVLCALRRGDIVRSGSVLSVEGTLPDLVEPMVTPAPQEQVATTHVGIDTLAPLFWRGSLGVYGDGSAGLVGDLLTGLDPLVVEAAGRPGAVAMALRETIEALQQTPNRIVWLRSPAQFLARWIEVDGRDRLGDIALQTFVWTLYRLCGLGAVVADLPDRPDLVTVPERVWTSVAAMDNGALDLLRCRTRGPVSDRRRKNISRVQKLIASAAPTSDHALIFGFDELDEESARLVVRSSSLRDLLSGGQHSDLAALDDLLETHS
jgi:hypothetical protein